MRIDICTQLVTLSNAELEKRLKGRYSAAYRREIHKMLFRRKEIRLEALKVFMEVIK